MTRIDVRVPADDFDVAREIEALERSGNVGAIASFVGTVRDEDGQLDALELEHYPGMAEARIGEVARAAADRWPLDALTVIHRHGRILPRGQIVLVLASSRHRNAAFDAVRFVMDYLKTDAPFWKKELRADGTDGWVAPRESDDATRDGWN